MNLNLQGKRAIVCGSTQGIGKACALQLAKMGASVCLMARNIEALQATLTELDTQQGQKHSVLCADFAHPEHVKQQLDIFLASEGGVHILIHNTGGPAPGQAIDASPDAFLAAFNQHLITGQLLVQASVPFMKQEGFGRIINIISTSVKQPIKGLGVSNTIRGAVASWTKTLSLELGGYGITVNNVLPGYTQTARLEALIKGKADRAGVSSRVIEAELIGEIPAGRFGTASEIANMAVFLCTEAAAYVNGVNIPVDGGRTTAF